MTKLLEVSDEDSAADADNEGSMNMSLIRGILGSSAISLRSSSRSSIRKIDGRRNSKDLGSSGIESVGSSGSSTMDELKDQQELLQKMGRLKGKLKQSEIDLSAEKTLRRKKERNMIKLAKELTKRTKELTEKDSEINKLKIMVADLEAKLSGAQSDIEERIAANEKKAKEYNNDLNVTHQKYRDAVTDADTRIAAATKKHASETAELRRQARDATIELERLRTQLVDTKKAIKNSDSFAEKAASKHETQRSALQKKQEKLVEEHEARVNMLIKKHTQQADEMRKEIFETNLECDKLKSRLSSIPMQESSGSVQAIHDRALALYVPANKRSSSFGVVFIIIVLLAATAAAVSWLELWSMDSVCAPAMPGTRLDKDVTLSAPWWAPEDFKQDAFEQICANRTRTTLYWTSGLLLIKDTNSKIVVEKRANSAVVKADSIDCTRKKGKIETIRAPWVTVEAST